MTEKRGAVNESGFPLQIWVHDQVEETRADHSWNVVTSEHRFVDAEGEGFIDLVFEKGMMRAIVECKRHDATWTFLVTRADERNVTTTRALWSILQKQRGWLWGYCDRHAPPESMQSSFCVISRPSGNREQLEGPAGTLVRAMESIAVSEMRLQRTYLAFYVPVIVTTAKLFVIEFEPKEVDPLDGCLPHKAPKVVNWIRFRKSLSTSFDWLQAEATSKGFSVKARAEQIPRSIADLNRECERTVFVVSAEKIVDFLRAFQFNQESYPNDPWVRDLDRR